MGHVRYDQSLYRTGFRPTGTNPFAATQMHGIFSPQHLHGLGQGGHVFTREGGWALHGLGEIGAIVPNGALVNYQGAWPLGDFSASDLLAKVTAALVQDGLAVRGVSSDAGFLAENPDVPTFVHVSTINVKLQLQVANGQGYGDPNDIVSIIRHEVFAATGQFPLSDSIPSFQVPGAAPSQTDQPNAVPYSAIDNQASFSNQPLDLGSWLQNNFVWIAAAAVGFVVLPKVLGR